MPKNDSKKKKKRIEIKEKQNGEQKLPNEDLLSEKLLRPMVQLSYAAAMDLEYSSITNSIDVNTFENYILRIDCNKAEDGLKTTPCSQNSLNALAIDEPLEYARLALDGETQAWVDAIDSLEIW